MSVITDLMAALEKAGLVVSPTNNDGDYYEYTHTISWPLCYKSATDALGDLGFGPEFPADITTEFIDVESVDHGIHNDFKGYNHVSGIDMMVNNVKHWIAGQYWTMA